MVNRCQYRQQQRLFWTALAVALAGATERQCKRAERLHPWGLSPLPAIPKQGRNFLQECDNLMDFLERVRGGSSSSDFDSRQQRQQQQASGYSGYGQDGGYSSGSTYNDNNNYYQDDNYYGGGGGGGGGARFGFADDDDDDDDDNYYYDDRGRGPASAGRQSSSDYGGGGTSAAAAASFSSVVDSMPAIFKNGDRRIGLSLVGAGSVVTMLGISLFFNKALLRLGNLLFISGVAITMGLSRTAQFFLHPKKLRSTVCLGLGIFLVFAGSPVFGMILEVFGLLNLFGNMFPVLLAIAKTLPGIGPLLNNMDQKKRSNNNRNNKSSRYDDYYEDDYYNEDDYGGGGGQSSSRGYYDDDGYGRGQSDGYGRRDDGYY